MNCLSITTRELNCLKKSIENQDYCQTHYDIILKEISKKENQIIELNKEIRDLKVKIKLERERSKEEEKESNKKVEKRKETCLSIIESKKD